MLLSLLLLFFGVGGVLSLGVLQAPELVCAQACFAAASLITYKDELYKSRAPCGSILEAQSTWLCAKKHCTEHEIEVGTVPFEEICELSHLEVLPYSLIGNFSEEQIDQLPIVSLSELRTYPKYDGPVQLSADAYESGYRTIERHQAMMNSHTHYGWAVTCFWALVVTSGILSRLINTLKPSQTDKTLSEPIEGPNGKRNRRNLVSRVRAWMKRTLFIPAAFNSHCRQPIGMCSVPPRLQTMMIAIFVTLNIVLCCVGYQTSAEDISWPQIGLQVSRYIADRCAVFCVANLPFMWLFAQRNNVLLWLTGWSFSTFNSFHRWTARVLSVQAFIHGICFSVYFLRIHSYFALSHEIYIRWGLVTISTIGMMLILANYEVRRRAYEFFLVSHIAFATIFLIGLYMHLEPYPVYRNYIWPCVAIWTFDRFVRIIKLIMLQLTSRPTQANASYDASADIVHLTVPVGNLVKPRPGQYYYIYLLNNPWKAWESHPFTIATWGSKTTSPVDQRSHQSLVTPTPAKARTTDSSKGSNVVSFMVRPYDSFTARLRNAASTSSIAKANLRVAVEGPYGSSLDLTSYSKVLFVVGGSGITVPLSYLCHLQQTASKTCQKIEMIWAVRQRSFLDSALRNGLQDQLNHLGSSMRMTTYVTTNSLQFEKDPISEAPSPSRSLTIRDENSKVLFEDISEPSKNRVTVVGGRPPIASIISSIATEGPGRVCVVTCGPGAMSDETRKAVTNYLKSDEGELVDLDFKDEGFGW